jgi:glycosyltransferase involved in cell wall biosynthesis
MLFPHTKKSITLYLKSRNQSNMRTPTITIITVVFNARIDFELTLNSMASQKLPDVEYVVIDGASTDGTYELALHSDRVIDRLISEPDRGIYDAMNKGIAVAKGKYLLFLNAGDTLANGTLDLLLKSATTESDLVCHAIKVYQQELFFANYQPEAPPTNPDPQHMYWPHPGILARRTVFDLIGNFDISLRCSADLDWINRVMRKHSLSVNYCRQPIVNFSLGGVSSTARSARESRRVAIRYGKSPLFAWCRYLKIRIRQIGFHLASIVRGVHG